MRPPLFDTHCHLFERGWRESEPGEEVRAYDAARRRFSITRSLVIGYEGQTRFHGNNAYVAAVCSTRPGLVAVPFADPVRDARGPSGPALALYLPDADAVRAADSLLARRRADGVDTRMVSVNAPPEALEQLAATAREHEETWFLVSHLGIPGRPDVAELYAVGALGRLANVSIKLSGQYAASLTPAQYPHSDVQPLVDRLADVCGVESLVWGSDFAPMLDHITFAQAVDSLMPTGVSDAERRAIEFDTAAAMLARFVDRDSGPSPSR